MASPLAYSSFFEHDFGIKFRKKKIDHIRLKFYKATYCWLLVVVARCTYIFLSHFHLPLLWGWHLWLWLKYLRYWMDYHQLLHIFFTMKSMSHIAPSSNTRWQHFSIWPSTCKSSDISFPLAVLHILIITLACWHGSTERVNMVFIFNKSWIPCCVMYHSPWIS